MLSASFRVVLDACVLYPMNLRDVLLQAAAEGLYQVYWSREILDEATRNLLANLEIGEPQAARLIAAMSAYFPESIVTDYEHLVPAMRNHAKDRHVAAAAVKAGAQVIVTANTKDFTKLPDGIEAQIPDEFLCNLFDLDPDRIMIALEKICTRRKRQPNDVLSVVDATLCSQFVALVGELLAGVDTER